MVNKKEKTIYELDLHETLTVEEKVTPLFDGATDIKKYEVTRVPGGWVYSFEYPGFRQSPIVFVPYHSDFKKVGIKSNKKVE